MMNQFKRLGRIGRAIGAVPLLVAAFILTQPQTGAAQVTGSGTAGNIPKFTGSSPSSTVGNSIITELNGYVGISATSPNSRLSINPGATEPKITLWDNGNITSAHYGFGISNGQLNYHVLDSGSSHVFYQGGKNGDGTPLMIIKGNGSVGIGTTSPNTNSSLHTKTAGINTLIIDSGSAAGTYSELALFDRGVYKWELVKTPDNQFGIYDSASGQYRVYIKNNGTVGIGTTLPDASYMLHVAGAVRVDGNIAAKYQDVAEWVPANRQLSAGTVVTLDPEHSNLVVASSHSYDTRVAGVVSEKPGVILGEGGDGKVMVATTGRVRVKVDATNGPIRVGDLLVTSDKEGIAMRSQPLDLGGTPIHRPGTLIGKALEPLEKGVGEILVLLSLQ